GFPARMLIPGRYGMKGPKWLEEIDVAASEGGGFWEQQGWDSQAVGKTTGRFGLPPDGGGGGVRGPRPARVAFAGAGGVERGWRADVATSRLQGAPVPPNVGALARNLDADCRGRPRADGSRARRQWGSSERAAGTELSERGVRLPHRAGHGRTLEGVDAAC